MKKVLFIVVLPLLMLFACDSDGDLSKDSYTFTVKQVTTCSPSLTGYPQTVTTVIVKDNITAEQAKEVAAELNTTTQATTGGYTITVTITCVYVLTKDYVPPTGTREPKV